MSRRVRLIAALVIPLVGIGALIVRGELRSTGDRVWRVPVEGYDPRDLLSGQYLRYRYLWAGEAVLCPGGPPDCCLCLSGASAGVAATPQVYSVDCAQSEQTEACDDLVRSAEVRGPERFYIDERYALAAETAMRERAASVELVVTAEGGVAVRELFFDGVPWRETLVPSK
ncbi:MAG: GDYXXLXY domain-containing protein [Myxococcota bacterium]